MGHHCTQWESWIIVLLGDLVSDTRAFPEARRFPCEKLSSGMRFHPWEKVSELSFKSHKALEELCGYGKFLRKDGRRRQERGPITWLGLRNLQDSGSKDEGLGPG